MIYTAAESDVSAPEVAAFVGLLVFVMFLVGAACATFLELRKTKIDAKQVFNGKVFVVTSLVPADAWATLRTISWVAAPCSSTAVAIEAATPAISRMRVPIPPIAPTA